MNLVQIYECFCDETRLRIINLLNEGPLCVCHFQELLEQPQVKISKHLAYLRSKGLVQGTRRGSWIVYSLPAKPTRELHTNLSCLQECVSTHPVFRQDLRRRRAIASKVAWVNSPEECCAAQPSTPGRAARGRAAGAHAAARPR